MKVASEKADIIWVDTHLWPEYGTSPTNDQQQYSREAVTLGADIVTGVSSHEIQGMTFINETPVFYGLGNFLFDQMWSDETRQGLVLEITLYDNAIRKIELLPTVMYEYCQPRFVEDNQKDTLLDYFFSISNL
jgi:poly-gamma-glutamate synthesis protein (capsule biosynthesis protein)